MSTARGNGRHGLRSSWIAAAVLVVLAAACTSSSKPAAPESNGTVPPLGEVAYVQNGDIWVKPLPDGTARRLTTDGSYKSPKWSPSGAWLWFTGTDANFVVRSDGSERRQVEAASWAPSADRLVSMDDGGTITIENADGSDRIQITTPAAGPAGSELRGFSAALSWDGQSLAFEKMMVTPGALPGYAYDGIWRVRIDGSNGIELYNTGTPPEGLGLIGWSRDSKIILLQHDIGFSASLAADGLPLEVISANGRSHVKITDGTLTRLGWDDQPTGGLIAITDGAGRQTWTNKRIALFDPSQATVTPLTDDTTAAFSAAWSPDDSRLAYVSAPNAGDIGGGDPAREEMSRRRIWVMNADGSGKRQLTDDNSYRDERPRWSADGSEIVFARLDAEDHASLWLIPSGGGDPHQMVDDLSPNPMPDAPFWWGYYGYVAWDSLFDVWRPQVAGRSTRTQQTLGTSTPDPALPFVFDLKTFAHIDNINGTGRVPLGLLNEVTIDRADARFKGFYAGENLPQDMYLYLSIITAAARDDFQPPGAPSYEWWFTTTDASDEQQLSPDHAAQLRIGLRYVDGGWDIYADRGSGWQRVPGGDFNFGQYEVSAKVRVDESWGISQIGSTFFRALTRDEGGFITGISDVGDMYPRDLTWRQVFRY